MVHGSLLIVFIFDFPIPRYQDDGQAEEGAIGGRNRSAGSQRSGPMTTDQGVVNISGRSAKTDAEKIEQPLFHRLTFRNTLMLRLA